MPNKLSLEATIDSFIRRSKESWGLDPKGRLLKMQAERKERRKDIHHTTTHKIALMVISIFLIILALKIFITPSTEIPPYFISIVSTVIGFYFAHSINF